MIRIGPFSLKKRLYTVGAGPHEVTEANLLATGFHEGGLIGQGITVSRMERPPSAELCTWPVPPTARPAQAWFTLPLGSRRGLAVGSLLSPSHSAEKGEGHTDGLCPGAQEGVTQTFRSIPGSFYVLEMPPVFHAAENHHPHVPGPVSRSLRSVNWLKHFFF